MSRIYVIYDNLQQPRKTRLVRADNKAQAIRYVVADWIAAKVASQDDLVILLGAGGHIVEDATPELPEESAPAKESVQEQASA